MRLAQRSLLPEDKCGLAVVGAWKKSRLRVPPCPRVGAASVGGATVGCAAGCAVGAWVAGAPQLARTNTKVSPMIITLNNDEPGMTALTLMLFSFLHKNVKPLTRVSIAGSAAYH